MSLVRVMTYNIWRGGRGGRYLDAAVRSSSPDILLVNEAPKVPVLWKHRCLALTRRWGLAYVAGGRVAGSNMIVSVPGVGVESTYVEVLPEPLLQPRRGVAVAQLVYDGVPLGVVSCHLSLDPRRRPAEVERVLELAAGLRGAVVVAGDLNEPPQGQSWRRLREAGFVDHGSERWLTFPAARPTKRIDALLVRGDVEVLHHGDPGIETEPMERGSDHRPVLAVLGL